MADIPTLRIRNWDKWQSYRRDRGQPPWIKLHRTLVTDPSWVNLSDAQRGQLVAIWMLAADRNGVIPNDPVTIMRICNMQTEPDLNFYIAQGFVSKEQRRRRASKSMTHQRREEAEEETDKASNDDSGFSEWYAKYPRKVAKSAAKKAWNKLKSCDRSAAMDGLSTWPFSDDPKFIPHPASWLNGSRWEDEKTSHVNGEDYEGLI